MRIDDAKLAELEALPHDTLLGYALGLYDTIGELKAERDRLREALRRGIQAVEHNEKGDVRIDGRWTERAHVVSELRAALSPHEETCRKATKDPLYLCTCPRCSPRGENEET